MSELEFTKYWDADRARKKQTALTKLSNGLKKEVIDNPLASELFEPEEIEAMRVARAILLMAHRRTLYSQSIHAGIVGARYQRQYRQPLFV